MLSISSTKADAQTVINWTVVGQLSWECPRAPTLDRCSLSEVIVKLCLQHNCVAWRINKWQLIRTEVNWRWAVVLDLASAWLVTCSMALSSRHWLSTMSLTSCCLLTAVSLLTADWDCWEHATATHSHYQHTRRRHHTAPAAPLTLRSQYDYTEIYLFLLHAHFQVNLSRWAKYNTIQCNTIQNL